MSPKRVGTHSFLQAYQQELFGPYPHRVSIKRIKERGSAKSAVMTTTTQMMVNAKAAERVYALWMNEMIP
jgi:hypothetical protein